MPVIESRIRLTVSTFKMSSIYRIVVFTCIYLLLISCASTTHTRAEFVEIDPSPHNIIETIKPGNVIKVKMNYGYIQMKVTGFLENKYILGVDELSGQRKRIALNDIINVTVIEIIQEESEPDIEITSPSDFYYLTVALALVAEDKIIDHIDSYRYKKVDVIREETKQFKGLDQKSIQASMGEPFNKYTCKNDEESLPYQMWEYTDDRLESSSKYFIFAKDNNKLSSVSQDRPSGCCAYLDDIQDKTSPSLDEICQAQDRRKETEAELGTLIYAKHLLSGGVDPESIYRLLESGLGSEHDEVRNQYKQFIHHHPEILDGAKDTFTPESLRKCKLKHGDNASEIENRRLTIYKSVADDNDYLEARHNYIKVLGGSNRNLPNKSN